MHTLYKVSQCDRKTYVTPQRWKEEIGNEKQEEGKEKTVARGAAAKQEEEEVIQRIKSRDKCKMEGTFESETVDVRRGWIDKEKRAR